MKLYFSPGACSLSPHIALCETGLPYNLVRVDLATKKTADGGNFLAVNPDGYVPVLQLQDGSLLTEGPAIVQYIADRVPEKGLAPVNGSVARYRLQSQLNFISTELHKSFSALFNPVAGSDWKKFARTTLTNRISHLQDRMAGPYAMGEQFTVADCYLFTVLSWCKYLEFDLAPWHKVVEYQGRIAARPAVRQALKEEGLIETV